MTLPIFLFALPAGVLADRLDRRKWLLFTQSSLLGVAMVMAVTDWAGLMSPMLLLILTACLGVATILNQPAWQAITPELVPLPMVPSAVATGSISFNLARAIGPALGGLFIANLGTWATFLFNALSFLGVILLLSRWDRKEETEGLRRASFANDLASGWQFVWGSSELRSVLVRVFCFAFCSSILWSLLPLVATEKLHFQARGFGILLASIGLGAVAGAWWLATLRKSQSSERIVLLSALAFAAVFFLISVSNAPILLFGGLVIVGAGWLSGMTTLNATAQIKLPKRLRARGMATYLMAFALGMTIGSASWGWVAAWLGIDWAFRTATIAMTLSAFGCHHLPLGDLRME